MRPDKPYREVTVATVGVGIVFGIILNAAICFAGLQIGFTIVGCTVAAVVGFGTLRGILRQGSILEVNIFQTVASCVNTVNAGIIFTVPVLFILGKEHEINYPALVLAGIGGAFLGVAFIIPMRKQILDFERLRFPEGVATAAILKAPGAGIRKSVLLVVGIALSATTAVGVLRGWLPEEVDLGKILHLPPAITGRLAISLLSLGAGYLAGSHGLAVLYGAFLNYWFLVPVCLFLGWVPTEYLGQSVWFQGPEGLPDYQAGSAFVAVFRKFTSRHVGIGMILGGAIAGIIVAAPALKAALGSLRSAKSTGEREEVSFNILVLVMVVGGALVLLAAKLAGGEAVTWLTALLVAGAGIAWLWVAGLVVAQTTGRTDWSPLSGLALIATAIMMGIMGTDDRFIVPAVTMGAAVCVATSMAADMMTDLKSGYLVGGRPARQQLCQLATCWIGPGVSILVVWGLWNTYAFGPNQAKILYDRAVQENRLAEHEEAGGSETKLPKGVPELGAPQAGALQGAISLGQAKDVPRDKYLTGAFLGLVMSLLVSPGLGVLVGLSMYLDFHFLLAFGIGCLLNMLVSKLKSAHYAEDTGVPLAAGLIVGDALSGIVHAGYKIANSLL